jgi:hypothetical protein
MDFNKPSNGLVTPFFSKKQADPLDDFDPNDMWVWQPVLGPADSGGRSAPNPMSPSNPDPMPSLLAFTLNWRVAAERK